ncbi:M15 family metallopeptidase [Bacteroides sp. 519]|uniref:M15 family metallopeptidase n=1 Tax=Bacteroides sp. 519 TaxID=2302937 RepID=UPI00351AA702
MNSFYPLKIIAKHICNIAKELDIPVAWGGNWKMRDYPHFELDLLKWKMPVGHSYQ